MNENPQHYPISNSVSVHILLNVIRFGAIANWKHSQSSARLTLAS